MQTNPTCTLLVTSANGNQIWGRASPTAFQKRLRDERFQQTKQDGKGISAGSSFHAQFLPISQDRENTGDRRLLAAKLRTSPRPRRPASSTNPSAIAPSLLWCEAWSQPPGSGPPVPSRPRCGEGGQPRRKPDGRPPSRHTEPARAEAGDADPGEAPSSANSPNGAPGRRSAPAGLGVSRGLCPSLPPCPPRPCPGASAALRKRPGKAAQPAPTGEPLTRGRRERLRATPRLPTPYPAPVLAEPWRRGAPAPSRRGPTPAPSPAATAATAAAPPSRTDSAQAPRAPGGGAGGGGRQGAGCPGAAFMGRGLAPAGARSRCFTFRELPVRAAWRWPCLPCQRPSGAPVWAAAPSPSRSPVGSVLWYTGPFFPLPGGLVFFWFDPPFSCLCCAGSSRRCQGGEVARTPCPVSGFLVFGFFFKARVASGRPEPTKVSPSQGWPEKGIKRWRQTRKFAMTFPF